MSSTDIDSVMGREAKFVINMNTCSPKHHKPTANHGSAPELQEEYTARWLQTAGKAPQDPTIRSLDTMAE
jgi:hypothetical protein